MMACVVGSRGVCLCKSLALHQTTVSLCKTPSKGPPSRVHCLRYGRRVDVRYYFRNSVPYSLMIFVVEN